MMIPVSNHIAWFAEQWKWTSGDFPHFNHEYSPQEKVIRENYTTTFYNRFKENQDAFRKGHKKADPAKFIPGLVSFLDRVYDFPKCSEEIIINRSFFDISRQFYQCARNFDPGLHPGEIYQAMRNVWIMNGIQLMLNIPVELTPSIIAYSLLYPYSDNLLDDPNVPETDKLLFSNRFEQRLKGFPIKVNDHREEKISNLVAMIEKQYRRDDFPEVYQSLLAIHAAQTQSVLLQKTSEPLSEKQIIELCFAKGGTSVLADGFLVAGKLTPLQQRFLFGYGIWLQLADDVQDMAEDRSEEVTTLFTTAFPELQASINLNRTIHFGRAIINDIGCFPSEVCSNLGKIMVHAIEMMVVQAVALNHEHFHDDKGEALEKFSPLSFNYIRTMKKKGTSQRMKLVTSMISMDV